MAPIKGRKEEVTMKKRIILALLCVVFVLLLTLNARAEELQLMRVTCYCPESCSGTVTASGTKPVPNYSCGARRDMIGCVALVYENNNGIPGDFIGLYEITDTGSAPRIQSGKSIDIYQASLSDAKAFVKAHGDYLFVQIVKGEG